MDIQEDILTVDTVLHLRNSDHTVSVKKFIYEPNEANTKVADAWNAFFQKDKNTPLDSWGEVEEILPQLPQTAAFNLPPLEVELWRRTHSQVSKRSARGPCGFSVVETQQLPDWILKLLFLIFEAIHSGNAWPELWVKAYTVFLPKTSDPSDSFQ